MNNFFTIMKNDFKNNSIFKHRRNIFNYIFSTFIAILICIFIGYAFNKIVESYLEVKLNFEYLPYRRAEEIINICYLGILIILFIMALEKLRRLLVKEDDKKIIKVLPIKSSTLYLSRLTSIFISLFIYSAVIVFTFNILVYINIDFTFVFFLRTFLVSLAFPLVALMFSMLLLIPYTLFIDFLKRKPLLMLISLIILVCGLFFIYYKFLFVIQTMLETGNIKFLFNETFVNNLSKILRHSIVTNFAAKFVISNNYKMLVYLLLTIIFAVTIIVLLSMSLVGKVTSEWVSKPITNKKVNYKQRPKLLSFIKKEALVVMRTPDFLFSYITISFSLPLITFCCYTMYKTLLENALGFNLNFEIATFVILVFLVLSNSFSTTNISRDKEAIVSVKPLPATPKEIIGSKVIFCLIVSLSTVVITAFVPYLLGGIKFIEFIYIILISCVILTMEILISTRLDLNKTKKTSDVYKSENSTSFFVYIELALSFLIGVLIIVAKFIFSSVLYGWFLFLILLILVGLLIGSYIYYKRNLDHQFKMISR